MTQPIHQVQSFPQRLPSITENRMGALSACPVEILLSIFDYLNDKDLRNISLVNWACNQFIENRTSWAKSWREYKRLFQIFQRALIEGNITPKPPIAAINAFSTPFTPTHTFRISDNSTICISGNLQSCGRLDMSQEGTSSSPLLPFIFNLFGLPTPPLSDIYHSEMSQEGNDLHITLLINTHRGQEPYSSHFLTYEIDKAKASSCYIGNLKSYYRSQGAGICIKNIERVVQQNGIFEAKEKLNFYEHPRKKFYQVCGVFGDWVMIVTSPSKHPHSHPTVHFYDKENLREEFYYKLPPSTTVSNPPYIRDNTCVFNTCVFLYSSISLIRGQKRTIRPFLLTPQAQEKLNTFTKITNVSYRSKENGEMEMIIEGENETGKVEICYAMDPSTPLSSFPPSPPVLPRFIPLAPPPLPTVSLLPRISRAIKETVRFFLSTVVLIFLTTFRMIKGVGNVFFR